MADRSMSVSVTLKGWMRGIYFISGGS